MVIGLFLMKRHCPITNFSSEVPVQVFNEVAVVTDAHTYPLVPENKGIVGVLNCQP